MEEILQAAPAQLKVVYIKASWPTINFAVLYKLIVPTYNLESYYLSSALSVSHRNRRDNIRQQDTSRYQRNATVMQEPDEVTNYFLRPLERELINATDLFIHKFAEGIMSSSFDRRVASQSC